MLRDVSILKGHQQRQATRTKCHNVPNPFGVSFVVVFNPFPEA